MSDWKGKRSDPPEEPRARTPAPKKSMVTASLTFFSLLCPPKSLRPTISRRSIPVGGFVLRSTVFKNLRASGLTHKTDMSSTDALRNSGGVMEISGLGEAEAILGNRASESQLHIAPGSVEATINRLSKWVVACVFGIFILWKHDAEAMWAAMGSVVNTCISVALKHLLNHQRPIPATRSDPGMPSSHAQSIFFTAFFIVLSLVHLLGINVLTVTVGVFTLACSLYLSWLRISMQFHTVSQVGVGAALGSACAITWFWLWHAIVIHLFISHLWVRIVVILGSATLCIAFLVHVVRHWLSDEL